MRRTNHRGSRGGFTLVELLVVVTIIAVLIALISSGVMAALARGTEVTVRNEVTQLANAVQAFKAQFQVQYVPDRLVLPPHNPQTGQPWDAVAGQTAQFLTSVWPRLPKARLADAAYWQVVTKGGPQILHGDQVLVWALGGWRDLNNNNNVFGFNTDPTDPMKPYTPGQQRHGPFFDGFTPDRLRTFAMPSNPEIKTLPKRANSFPSFVDYYGRVPYLYFSSGKAGNDYANQIAAPTEDPNTYILVAPYKLAGNKFANPNGFQIICAGRDLVFGGGDLAWSGGAGQTSLGGKDDLANFSATKLGD